MMQQFKTGLSNSRVKRICKRGRGEGLVTFDTVDGVRTGKVGVKQLTSRAEKMGEKKRKKSRSHERRHSSLMKSDYPTDGVRSLCAVLFFSHSNLFFKQAFVAFFVIQVLNHAIHADRHQTSTAMWKYELGFRLNKTSQQFFV
ncbi:hypothetical protein TNCV_102241 [Trichonephila clavipes]|nr:hypothetical protein TNCV_102241 [Trichonephila clavipes]